MVRENYKPRGIGTGNIPCYICNSSARNKVQPEMAAFVDNKSSGERIIEMFKDQNLQATLDYREHEPKWVQVKLGACKRHLPNLEYLERLSLSMKGSITPQIIGRSVSLGDSEFYGFNY